MGETVRFLHFVVWAVRALGRYTSRVPFTTVICEDPLPITVISARVLQQDLAAMSVELSMYNVRWSEGPNHWKMVQHLMEASDQLEDDPELDTPQPVPRLEHR